MRSGQFTFTIPAETDMSDDEFRFIMPGASDLSGNTAIVDPASEWSAITSASPGWDFESGPQGWTCTDDRWEWGTPGHPVSSDIGFHCWGTALGGQYDRSWDTRLVSPTFYVGFNSPALRFRAYTDLNTGDYWQALVIVDGVEHQLNQIIEDDLEWLTFVFSLDEFVGKQARAVFRFVSDENYSTGYGVYIDNVSITESP